MDTIDQSEITDPIENENQDEVTIEAEDQLEANDLLEAFSAPKEVKAETTEVLAEPEVETTEVTPETEVEAIAEPKKAKSKKKAKKADDAIETATADDNAESAQPTSQFGALPLQNVLLQRLEAMKFVEPTLIQQLAIPPALEGKDIIGSAATGTGKTAAFSLPLISKLLDDQWGDALILVPTRELAMQVAKAVKQFLGKLKINTALLIGGEMMSIQRQQLRRDPRIIIGTPGRVFDHLERGTLKLNDVCFFVLDEVDRMLDMGFSEQLDDINEYLPEERQTLMFSATVPKRIEAVAKKYLKEPVRVCAGKEGTPAKDINQQLIRVAEADKYEMLLEQLEQRLGSVIVFVNTKIGADRLSRQLGLDGIKADALHGDLNQSRRNRTTERFRQSRFRVLVATDVAARGLDIPHIEHVINYDLPQNPEDYVHRIGRTARAGAKGEAVNFLAPRDQDKWYFIECLLDPSKKKSRHGKSSGKPGKWKKGGSKGGYRGASAGRGRSEGGRRSESAGRRSEGGYRGESAGRGRSEGGFNRDGDSAGRPRTDGSRRNRAESAGRERSESTRRSEGGYKGGESAGRGRSAGGYRGGESAGRGRSEGGYRGGESAGRGRSEGGYRGGESAGRGRSEGGYRGGESAGRGRSEGGYRGGESAGRGRSEGGYRGESAGRGRSEGGRRSESAGRGRSEGGYRGGESAGRGRSDAGNRGKAPVAGRRSSSESRGGDSRPGAPKVRRSGAGNRPVSRTTKR